MMHEMPRSLSLPTARSSHPRNLLCTTADVTTAEIKLGDFGFAKIFGHPEASAPTDASNSFLVTPKGPFQLPSGAESRTRWAYLG